MQCCRFQVDEVSVRGKMCSRVDLGNSMRVTIIDVTAVQDVQVNLRDATSCGGNCHDDF